MSNVEKQVSATGKYGNIMLWDAFLTVTDNLARVDRKINGAKYLLLIEGNLLEDTEVHLSAPHLNIKLELQLNSRNYSMCCFQSSLNLRRI